MKLKHKYRSLIYGIIGTWAHALVRQGKTSHQDSSHWSSTVYAYDLKHYKQEAHGPQSSSELQFLIAFEEKLFEVV